MGKKATVPELKAAFTEHLEVTRTQIGRLEEIFTVLEASPKGKKCKAMEGLVAEGAEVIEEDGDPAVIDAALIACAQRVEHYEMAGYGCVRTFATLLGYEDAAALLQETLDEECEADKKLTELAETVFNVEAEEADGEEDEAEGDEEADEEDEGEELEAEEEEPKSEEPAPKANPSKSSPKKPAKK